MAQRRAAYAAAVRAAHGGRALFRFIGDPDVPIDNNPTEREFQNVAKLRLNMLFAGDRNDVPFDELYSRLIRKEPRAIRAGRKAVEEALFAMEAAQKVMYREGVIHLI